MPKKLFHLSCDEFLKNNVGHLKLNLNPVETNQALNTKENLICLISLTPGEYWIKSWPRWQKQHGGDSAPVCPPSLLITSPLCLWAHCHLSAPQPCRRTKTPWCAGEGQTMAERLKDNLKHRKPGDWRSIYCIQPLHPLHQSMSYQSASICAAMMVIRRLNTDRPPTVHPGADNKQHGGRLNVLTALWQHCERLWAVKVLCEQSGWSRPAAKEDDTDRHHCVSVCEE